MPEKKTIERVRRDRREGKAPSTQAGEFVREEIEHVREGKHGARSASQAIAIGLSKARRAGVELPPPPKGATSEKNRRSAKQALEAADKPHSPSPKRSRAITEVLKREGQAAASETALASHARAASRKRTASERSAAARKAARTKGPAEQTQAAQKAARTRTRLRGT
jgi:hypothetical protein